MSNVKSSCGCTSPEYSKAPIASGKSGFVTVTFDPKNRPGPFDKSITVTSNSKVQKVVLHITGKVLPRAKTITDTYPQVIGDLRVRSTHFSFSKIKNTKKKTDSLLVYNGSGKNIKVEFVNVPSYLTLKLFPSVLKPGQKGKIVGTYNAVKKNDYGFIMDKIIVKINGVNVKGTKLSVSSTIIEDFSKLTAAQLANAPKAVFEKKVYNFGTIKQGEKRTYDFVLKNEGKSDLIIRKIKSSCNCTVVQPKVKIIKPGQSTVLTTTFDSMGRRSKQRKTINLVTNDPKDSTIKLTVVGNVELP